jgi:hypothetical protein
MGKAKLAGLIVDRREVGGAGERSGAVSMNSWRGVPSALR